MFMWIYFVSLTICFILTNAILSVVIPKLKKREEIENAVAETTKTVYPDKHLKVVFVCLSFFCLLIGLILLFVPQVCELMDFDWLTTNIIWDIILLMDLAIILFSYQILYVSYNDDFVFITNLFRKTYKINYSEIISISSNVLIITQKKRFFLSGSLFYGVSALKDKITEKLNIKQ